MAESTDQAKHGFVEGISVSPGELHAQFGIPLEEIAAFRDILRIYSRGERIIEEGDSEKALYLLRLGTVEVFKGAGASQEAMGRIDAVNFFGEMSMINDEPRSATVISATDQAVVYRIPNPSIHTILTNPLWAELLISRLARNLARSVEQNLAFSKQVKTLRAELERSKAE